MGTEMVLNQSIQAVVATSMRDYDGKQLPAGDWLITCDQKWSAASAMMMGLKTDDPSSLLLSVDIAAPRTGMNAVPRA